MSCPSSGSLHEQVLCIFDQHKVVYTDCDGVVQGDCGMCAGEGDNIVSNTIAFNPGTDQITTVVNGIAAFTTIGLDSTDVTISGALTVGGVLYPIGTPLHTVISAIVVMSHPAASVSGGSNPALSIVGATQVLNLDLTEPGSYDNTVSGLTADNIQDAIDELNGIAAGLPSGNIGEILLHNGTTFVPALRVVDDITPFAGGSFLLANPPAAGSYVDIFRNGQLLTPGLTVDYTRVGQLVNLTAPSDIEERFKAIYLI